MNYDKQPINIDEQLALLQNRGLVIEDIVTAKLQLRNISYFRIASYLRYMEQDRQSHLYKSGCTFEQAINLYLFDKELRQLIFKAIQDIEISLRTKMIQVFSMEHGASWFMDSSLFKNEEFYEGCLENIKKEVSRSNEDFIKEHSDKYTSPMLPPVWKTLEVVSFGTLSKLFCLFKDNRLKKQVAREFGLPQYTYLESWIRCITVLRNCCAHHARVWNRRFALKPQLPNRLPLELDYSNPEAHQAVPSVVYLIIFGAIHHSLHGLEKFFVRIIDGISQYRFTRYGLPCGVEGRSVVAIKVTT